MDVFIERSGELKKIAFEGTVDGLLTYLKINPETVMVSRENILLVNDELVGNTDSLKVLSVISGG